MALLDKGFGRRSRRDLQVRAGSRPSAGVVADRPPSFIRDTRARTLGILAGIAAALIFGGGAVVSRHLVTAALDPVDLTLVRYLGCFPLAVVAVLAWPKCVKLDLPWRRLGLLMLLAGPPYQLLLIAGYLHATSGGGALLVTGLLPVFAIGVALLLAGAIPRRLALMGSAMTVIGIIMFAELASEAAFSPLGLAIFCSAALAWALLNHYVAAWQVDPLGLTVALALWSPLFAPVYFLLRPWHELPMPSADFLLQLAYHGWLVAFGATILYFACVRLAGAYSAAALLALTPACAAGLGAALLAEPLTLLQLSGAALTTLGVAAMAGCAPPRH